MSRQLRSAIFLERRSYRQRRLMDALRLLPILGLLLWMLPLFWPLEAPLGPVGAARAIPYIFGVWALLIACSCALGVVLKARLSADVPVEDETGPHENGGT